MNHVAVSGLVRCAMLLCLLVAGIPAAETGAAAVVPATVPASAADIDRLVGIFNPNMWSPDQPGQKVVVGASNAFTSPASDVARRVQDLTWLTSAVFLPFLVLPIILLLYVIFRFRDRGDGRPAATFMGNHTLELIWTAIPILALLLVAYPLWVVIDYMESPPADGREPLVITVVGKSFAWDYEYKEWLDPAARQKQPITLGQDVVGAQEALVLPKGRPVVMNFTSNDVNHAWWIPAFGIKKDCIKGRFTRAWFTPDRTGTFKGQCVELCGPGHGIMIIAAVVVEPADYQRFIELCRCRDQAGPVWSALDGGDAAAQAAAVAGYLGKGDSAERRFALRYWVASNAAGTLRAPQGRLATLAGDERARLMAGRRQALDALLASTSAH